MWPLSGCLGRFADMKLWSSKLLRASYVDNCVNDAIPAAATRRVGRSPHTDNLIGSGIGSVTDPEKLGLAGKDQALFQINMVLSHHPSLCYLG